MLSTLNVTACRLAARSALTDGAALADCVLPASFSDRHADETVTRYVSATLKLGDRNVDFNSLPLSARIEQPFVEQWHLVTQNILFRHLRQLWADDRPRTMVDIGCHAVCCVHAWGCVNCMPVCMCTRPHPCTACMCTAHVHLMCTSQGHSHRKNLSDATLWLDHFQRPGGTVLGVDLLEDYALDLQHR